MTSLRRRLADGAVLILDGAVGSEIQRRGVTLDRSAWSGYSHCQHPDLVLGLHRDYIAAGAEVITANTFSAAKHILEGVGLGERFEAVNREAVDLAKRARDLAAGREVLIAGSLSTIPPLDRPDRIPSGPEVADNYRRQAEILAAAGADLLVAEMLLDCEGAAILLDACVASGLPVWAGFSASFAATGSDVMAFRAPGKYTAMPVIGFEEMLESVLRHDLAAVGVMHSKLPVMASALGILAQHWPGPKMAYAETGRSGDSSWFFEDIVSPETYAGQARAWIDDFGVQIVGGCCGTSPAHIAAVARMLGRAA